MENKTDKFIAGTILTGLMLWSNTGYASLGDKFNKYIGNDGTHLSSIYILLGVIGVGIIGKVLHHYFMREEERKVTNVKITPNAHHRHHRPRPVVKKTS
jgi:hypothetical protein